MCSSWELQKAISPCYELIICKPNKPHIQSFVGLAYKLSSLIKNNGFKSGILYTLFWLKYACACICFKEKKVLSDHYKRLFWWL